ncbi:MAG: hypothetical protein ACI8QS_002990 [Planctomycetota bacterium]|jgi:hypothetical protein
MRTAFSSVLVLLLFLLPGYSQFPPDLDPTVGPVEVFVTVSNDTAPQGGFNSADIAVVNNSNSITVRVILITTLVYADGKRSILNLTSPQVLGPKGAIVLIPTFIVPSDAALGTAQLKTTVVVAQMGGLGNMASPMAQDSDTFDVVAP